MMYSDRAPLAEPVVVSDTFASGLARIEDVGGVNVRFTLFTKQRSTAFNDEREEHVVVARIIMPVIAVREAIAAAQIALEGVQGIIHDIIVESRH